MGKSLRKTKTETDRQTDGGAAQGSLLLASPQQGVSPSRSIQQGAGDSRLHLRQPPDGLVLNCTDHGPGETSLCVVARNVSDLCQGSLPSLAKELAYEAAN
jgi:hypothetical protein